MYFVTTLLHTDVQVRGCYAAATKDAARTALQCWPLCGTPMQPHAVPLRHHAHTCTPRHSSSICTQHPTSRLHPPGLLQLPVRGYCFTLKLGNLQASPVHPSDHMHSNWDIPWLHSRCSDSSSTTRYQGTAVSTPALAVVKPSSCSCSVSGAGQQVCHSVAGHCAEWMTVVHS